MNHQIEDKMLSISLARLSSSNATSLYTAVCAVDHEIRLETLSHQVTIPDPEDSVDSIHKSARSDSIVGVAGLSQFFERFSVCEFEECVPEIG
jgi:hypothetical protein